MHDPAMEAPGTVAQLRHRCLRELVHALNGRASVVRGLAEIAGMEHGERPTDLAGLLSHEADALEGVARALQLVVPPVREEAELLDPLDSLDEALELLGTLGTRPPFVNGHRAPGPAADAAETIPPIRTRASVFRGSLLVALEQARRILAGRSEAEGEDPGDPGTAWLRRAAAEGLALEVDPGNGSLPIRIPLPHGVGERSEPRI